MAATVGLDVGGTKILGVALDDDGTVVALERLPSPQGDFAALVEALAETAARLTNGGAPIGVGIAGLVSRDGRLSFGPNLPGLVEAPVAAALAEATGRRVAVDNDANAAALAEVTYGAARGARHALVVTLGTGIGGGLVLDGELYRGAHGFAAEIGHFTVERDGRPCACGGRGHWETIASGSALGRAARELVASGGGAAIRAAAGDGAGVAGYHVGEAARAGDSEARDLLARHAGHVAVGLAGLANVLDPELIVIAGGLVELGPLLFEPLEAAFAREIEAVEHRPAVPIVPAALGERAGAIGAAVLGRTLR